MKLRDFWYLATSLLIFSPWLLLLVEGVTLFLTGHVLTSIPWNEIRVLVAVFFPFFTAMIFAGLS